MLEKLAAIPGKINAFVKPNSVKPMAYPPAKWKVNDAFERDVVQYLTDVYKYATMTVQDDLQFLVDNSEAPEQKIAAMSLLEKMGPMSPEVPVKLKDTNQLHRTLMLKKGMAVELTKNVDSKGHLVNDQEGLYKGCTIGQNTGAVAHIWVAFLSAKAGKHRRLKYAILARLHKMSCDGQFQSERLEEAETISQLVSVVFEWTDASFRSILCML